MSTFTKNYITPSGMQRLQNEVRQLHHVERPKLVETVAWAASNGDRSENADYIYGKKRLREIDRRLRFLSKRIESAQIIDPTNIKSDKVLFGATVTFETEDGNVRTVSIVGEDEFDGSRGLVSWKSPLAKALLGKTIDDEALLRKPASTEVLVVMQIEYLPIVLSSQAPSIK